MKDEKVYFLSQQELKAAKKLLKLISNYWKQLLLVFIATILYNLTTLAQPLLFKGLFENIFQLKSIMQLNLIIGAAVLLYLLRGVSQYGQWYVLNWVNSRVALSLQNRLYYRLLKLKLSTLDRAKLGDMYSRVFNDINLMSNDAANIVITFINSLITVIGALSWIIYKSWSLALLTVVTLPAIALVISKLSRRMGKATSSYQNNLADLSSMMSQGLRGIRTIKAMAAEHMELDRFKRKNDEVFDSKMKMVQVMATQRPLTELLASFGIIAISWYGGYLVIKGAISPGDVLAYWGYVAISVNPLATLARTLVDLKRILVAAHRVFELEDLELEGEGKRESRDVPSIRGDIEFKDVWLSYAGDGKDGFELKGVSFEIRAGEKVAIVGPTGAGKTSLISLLLRFYEPTRGMITVDGKDIKEYDLDSLRRSIGVLLQDPFIFYGTIRDNIVYPYDNVSDEDVIEAAKLAQIHDEIMRMPQGYMTYVGEGGVTLSGGQRQRLAIARLFLASPRIVVMDEPTSALDLDTERRLQEALRTLFEGRTVIVITHRPSLLKYMDRIVVISEGEVKEVFSVKDINSTELEDVLIDILNKEHVL